MKEGPVSPDSRPPTADRLLKVRIALHAGTAEARGGDYFGPTLNRVARLLEAGHGGQILLSAATQELVQDELPPDAALADLGSYRLRDLRRPERVYQIRHPDLPGEFPPLRSLNAQQHNLPQPVTSFIGRKREIEEVKRLLSTTRLLTVTGPGGTGKTRLVLKVAADLCSEHSDGVWLVELAPLADPALVPQAAARALGIREQAGKTLTETLVELLRSRQLMVVLDNCEHLLAASAALADALLLGCPGVRCLVTSREGLNIPGETLYRLSQLPLPELRRGSERAMETDEVAALTRNEAVQLFVDRATASMSSFAVTGQNAQSVAQLCRRLDGIPLAIELAAARVRALSVDQMCERLDRRFRLLTGGSRTAAPRQQTLRALVDWSYDLLTEPERALLRRLSVFAGGSTLEAAEGVCGELLIADCRLMIEEATARSPISNPEVLDLLTSLVEKSLVQYEARGGEGRYRLLDTIRQYGLERMQEAGESERMRGRHRDWFVDLAERAGPELFGPGLSEWVERLEAETGNLQTALDAAIGTAPEAALRIAGAIWSFWVIRGHVDQVRERLESLLTRPETAAPTASRARALHGAGVMAYFQADFARMGALIGEALAVAREVNERRSVAQALFILGIYHGVHHRDFARARTLQEESLAIAREHGEKWLIGMSLTSLGFTSYHEGNLERAEALFQESLGLMREVGNTWLMKLPLVHLAMAALQRGDLERAEALSTECLTLERPITDRWGSAVAVDARSRIIAARGRRSERRACWRRWNRRSRKA